MEAIGLDTYNLYSLHGGECLWVSDSPRVARPRGTSKKTDEKFLIIERLVEQLTMLATGLYTEKLKTEIEQNIEALRPSFTSEAFQIIKLNAGLTE